MVLFWHYHSAPLSQGCELPCGPLGTGESGKQTGANGDNSALVPNKAGDCQKDDTLQTKTVKLGVVT